jgi:hypothetical protein
MRLIEACRRGLFLTLGGDIIQFNSLSNFADRIPEFKKVRYQKSETVTVTRKSFDV